MSDDPLWRRNLDQQREGKLFLTMDDLTKKRSSAKRNVTATANIVEPMLKTTGADAFFIYDEVSEHIRKLQAYFDAFSVCHSNYVAKMQADSSEQEFEVLADEQDTYFREVNTRYMSIRKAFKKYELLCNTYKEASEAIPDVKVAFDDAYTKYRAVVSTIDNMTQSITDVKDIEQVRDVHQAESLLTYLLESYDTLVTVYNKYSILLQRTGLSSDAIKKETNFDIKAIEAKYGTLSSNLGIIVQVQSRSNGTNQLPGSSTAGSNSTSASNAIKLAKAENVTFSGDPRDFATFKKDFETIVVPNRPPYEI